MALLVRTGYTSRQILTQRRLHGPPKRIDRTHHQHWGRAVPADFPQRGVAVFRRQRLERPRGVRAQFRGYSEFAQNGTRLLVARNHQRLAAKTSAHFRNHRVHMARFRAVANRKLVLCRSHTQRTNHHRGQRIRELAFEHRPFARDHAMVPRNFLPQEGRKNIRQMHLPCVFEVSPREIKLLRHHAQFAAFRTQHVTHLA